VEQIKGQERDAPAMRPLEAVAELCLVRSARRIHHDQLTVEDRRAGIDSNGKAGELAQRGPEVPTVAILDPDLAAARHVRRPDRHQRSKAAPRWLEEVVRRIERFGQRARHHWAQPGWRIGQRRPIGFEPERELIGRRHHSSRW
jgi:hypothetical protein